MTLRIGAGAGFWTCPASTDTFKLFGFDGCDCLNPR